MKNFRIAAVIGVTSFLNVTAAQSEPYAIFYGGVSNGAEDDSFSSFVEGSDPIGFPVNTTWQEDMTFTLIPDDIGYLAGGAFGWTAPSGIGIEIDLSAQAIDYDLDGRLVQTTQLSGGILPAPLPPNITARNSQVSGRFETTSALVNLRYDFDNDTRMTPYLLAGVGWSALEAGNSVAFFGPTFLRHNVDIDGGWAYQLGAGFTASLNDRFGLLIGYRYFSIPEAEISWPAGCTIPVGAPPCFQNHASLAFNFSTHSAIVGLRIGF